MIIVEIIIIETFVILCKLNSHINYLFLSVKGPAKSFQKEKKSRGGIFGRQRRSHKLDS